VTLIIVTALAVLGYTYEWGEYSAGPEYYGYYSYTTYDYSSGYEYAHYYSEGYYYSSDTPSYIGVDMIALGHSYVFLSDFEIYDHELGLMALGDNVYYIDGNMVAHLIGPRVGITVTFNLNGGNLPLGELYPLQRPTTGIDGDDVWIGTGAGQMPGIPTRPGHTFMGWNTQPNGRGTNIVGDTRFCRNSWVPSAPTAFTVYAVWGLRLMFSGNPIALYGVGFGTPNQSDTNNFGDRFIPVGWTLNETLDASWITPPNTWPRNLGPGDFTGQLFVGWYSVSAPEGGVIVDADTRIYVETSAFARWTPDANFTVTFDPTHGSIPTPAHSNQRVARQGWSISESSIARPGLPSANPDVAWPRSAPLAIPPVGSGLTLEGWWTGHDGMHGTGLRFSSPGGVHATDNIASPGDWARRPITSNMIVYANWVYRVRFNLNQGNVIVDSQPDGFYDFHNHTSQRWFGFHGPSGHYFMFRDIPYNTPDGQRTIAQSGQQFNYGPIAFDPNNPNEQFIGTLGAIQPRTLLPDGERAPGFTALPIAPENERCVTRPGHLFNGWWCTALPPFIFLPVGSNNRHNIDPRNPSTLVGTEWQGQTFTEFTRYCEVNYSKTVHAHWVPNDEVVVTFNIGDCPINPPEWYRHYLTNHWAWNASINEPIPVNTNDLYHIALTQGSSVQNMNDAAAGISLFMPPHPRREGYMLLGWFTNPPPEPCPHPPGLCPDCTANGGRGNANAHGHLSRDNRGQTFVQTSQVPHSMTVYAHWMPYVTFVFDGNGGTLVDGVTTEWSRRAIYGWVMHTNTLGNNMATPGATQSRAVSFFNMRDFGYISNMHGPPVESLIPIMTGIDGNFRRPGFRPLRVFAGNVPWTLPPAPHPTNPSITLPGIPATPTYNARNNSAWNGSPSGNHEIFGISLETFHYFDMEMVQNREVRFYLQWGVPIQFTPLYTVPGVFTPRVITVPENHTFNNMINHRHTPPVSVLAANTQIPFPFSTVPAQFVPPAASIFNNTRDLNFPNPSVNNAHHWNGIRQEYPPGSGNAPFITLNFRGWYPTTSGAGNPITADTQMPVFHEGSIVHSVYGQWGDSITFMVGDHPNPGAVVIAPEDQSRGFPTGTPFTLAGLDGGFPPPPTFPTNPGDPTFIGWSETQFPPHSIVDPNLSMTRHASFNLYAVWAFLIPLDGNASDATLGTSEVFGLPGATLTDFNSVLFSQPTRGEWGFFRRWACPDNVVYTAHGPALPSIRANLPDVLYAQWEGRFIFNPGTGGTIPDTTGVTIGANGHATVWVTESFSIASHNTRIAGPPLVGWPPAQQPDSTTGVIPQMPHNPTHADPSLVFAGWRVVGGPLDGQVFDRNQANNIVMNGLVPDPTNPGQTVRNALAGSIALEAVWHQRLMFTKTGELLYLVYPNTNNTDRVAEPRNGAVFRLYRNTATTPGATTWEMVVNNVTSGAAGNVSAVGTPTGNTPFAAAISASSIPGLVVMNLPTTVALTPGGQYRLYEVQPPLGYMPEGGYWIIDMHPANTHPDARINTVTEVAPNHLPFVDWNTITDTPRAYMLQDFHVGNRRPRLMFTKLNRESEPLNGVRFILERYNTVTNQWEAMPDEYQPEVSGLNGQPIPLFPGQTPHPSPPPSSDGIVILPRPLPYNSTGQFRLRETEVPDNSGYLIPIFGRWNITTNRYSGVTAITVCSNYNVAPTFVFDPPSPMIVGSNAGHPRPWDGYWSVQNTPTRNWPILKTDGQVITPSFQHEYLGGAVFALFVWEGAEIPGADVLLLPSDIVGTNPGSPWAFVAERTSTGGENPVPMWFPMMPGRTYQLVEVLAPAGYQLPWGQWRFTVYGAECANTIAGTRLTPQTIGWGTPNVIPRASNVSCLQLHVDSGHSCECNDCDCDFANYCTVTMPRAYYIPNLPDFSLPLTGGTGIPIALTTVGTVLAMAGFIIMLIKAKPGESESQAK